MCKAYSKLREKKEFAAGPLDADVQPEKYAKVVLDLKHNRDAALRIAATIGQKSWGIVPTRKGWAVRVLAEDQEAVQKELNPTFVTGDMYSVSGLPLSWHEENVRNFLGDWDAKPVKSFRTGFRSTWLVRASVPPKAATLKNVDPMGLNVLAVVSPWKA